MIHEIDFEIRIHHNRVIVYEIRNRNVCGICRVYLQLVEPDSPQTATYCRHYDHSHLFLHTARKLSHSHS